MCYMVTPPHILYIDGDVIKISVYTMGYLQVRDHVGTGQGIAVHHLL